MGAEEASDHTVCSEGEERRGDAGPRAVAPHRVVIGDLDQKHDAPRVGGSGRASGLGLGTWRACNVRVRVTDQG